MACVLECVVSKGSELPLGTTSSRLRLPEGRGQDRRLLRPPSGSHLVVALLRGATKVRQLVSLEDGEAEVLLL